MRKLIIFTVGIFLFTIEGKAQNFDRNIDSVFAFYFDVVENELPLKYIPQKYPQHYNSIPMSNGDTVYASKYLSKAISFFEDIACIYAAKSINYSTSKKIDSALINKWKVWLGQNRLCIKWHLRKNKPYIPRR